MTKKPTPAKRLRHPATPPIILPLRYCPVCKHHHPKPKQFADGEDSPFLNAAQCAGFLGLQTVSVYSEKSRKHLPPVLPGRKSPCWDSCVLAVYLYEGRIIGPTFTAE